MPAPVFSSTTFLAIVLVLCLWARRGGLAGNEEPWRSRVDIPLAVASGLGFAVVSAWVLAPLHIQGGDYTDMDTPVYCTGLGALRDGLAVEYPGKLSPLVGLLLLPPTRWFGILPTLTVGAILSCVVFGAGMYLWVRIAAGRVAGIAAVILAAGNHHLVTLARNVSFYPETTAACLLGLGGVAAALRWGTPRALLAGGAGAGLMLLADTRFLTVAAWATALLFVAAVPGPRRRWVGRIARVVGPLVVSWVVARSLYSFTLRDDQGVSGIAVQTAAFLRDIPDFPAEAAPFEALAGLDHTWGREGPWRIPGALLAVADLTRHVPPERVESQEVLLARRDFVDPWLVPLAAAVVAIVLGQRKRPWALLAGIVLCVPFAANLAFVTRTLPQSRFFTLGMVSVPVILALGLGALGGERWPRRPAIAMVVFLGASVIGLLPGFLSPWAAWRTTDCGVSRVYWLAQAVRQGSADPVGAAGDMQGDALAAPCIALLAPDASPERLWMPFPDTPDRGKCGLALPTPFWAVAEPRK